MGKYPVNENHPWYHGSPVVLSELSTGSTITQWKELAEAFSHKPVILQYDDVLGTISHNGVLEGYLYIIDEPVVMGASIHPHPRSTMDEGVKWLTDKPLKLKLAE